MKDVVEQIIQDLKEYLHFYILLPKSCQLYKQIKQMSDSSAGSIDDIHLYDLRPKLVEEIEKWERRREDEKYYKLRFFDWEEEHARRAAKLERRRRTYERAQERFNTARYPAIDKRI